MSKDTMTIDNEAEHTIEQYRSESREGRTGPGPDYATGTQTDRSADVLASPTIVSPDLARSLVNTDSK